MFTREARDNHFPCGQQQQHRTLIVSTIIWDLPPNKWHMPGTHESSSLKEYGTVKSLLKGGEFGTVLECHVLSFCFFSLECSKNIIT